MDVTNQEVENLERRVIDLEEKLVKLAALEAAFDHFTNKHWIPLQAVVISLHDSLCWTCRGDGQPIPDRVRSALAHPSLSIAIPIPPPRTGQRPATPGPPPHSPVTDNDSSVCQEIGLVAFMFFFELFFSLCSSQFPSMFSLTNLLSIILFLTC